MRILGIETSCDETALSVIESENGADIAALADKTLSQAALHAHHGGVFPNLAKREHLTNLPAMLPAVLAEAGLSAEKPELDAIAVTVGPGLEPCLWTGIKFAEEFAKSWNVPIVPVNHMEGHIFSALLRAEENSKSQTSNPKPIQSVVPAKAGNQKKLDSRFRGNDNGRYTLAAPLFPALALLISGGHTELILIKKQFNYEIIGQTRDDAVGEAFDKVARLLGLPYPGGPEISRLSEAARVGNSPLTKGVPMSSEAGVVSSTITLPRPMLHSGDFDFSFSGLKTAVLYLLKRIGAPDEKTKAAIALEFEDAVTEVLVAKTRAAIERYGVKSLLIGGGVIANMHIRQTFETLGEELGAPVHIPEKNLTTDNALMIAVTGFLRLTLKNGSTKVQDGELTAKGNLRLDKKGGLC